MPNWKRIHEILQSADRDVRNGIAVAHTLETPAVAELGSLLMDARYDAEAQEQKIERLKAIVDKLPKDAEQNVYPPPRALQGKAFYHPDHLGPAARLFWQLFWHPDGYWGAGCGGWEVPLSECYSTREAAEAAKG